MANLVWTVAIILDPLLYSKWRNSPPWITELATGYPEKDSFKYYLLSAGVKLSVDNSTGLEVSMTRKYGSP